MIASIYENLFKAASKEERTERSAGTIALAVKDAKEYLENVGRMNATREVVLDNNMINHLWDLMQMKLVDSDTYYLYRDMPGYIGTRTKAVAKFILKKLDDN